MNTGTGNRQMGRRPKQKPTTGTSHRTQNTKNRKHISKQQTWTMNMLFWYLFGLLLFSGSCFPVSALESGLGSCDLLPVCGSCFRFLFPGFCTCFFFCFRVAISGSCSGFRVWFLFHVPLFDMSPGSPFFGLGHISD